MEQEFYVTLRIKTKSKKEVTEAKVKKLLHDAVHPDRWNEIVEHVSIGDVIEQKAKK